jgi:hypothetical protein
MILLLLTLYYARQQLLSLRLLKIIITSRCTDGCFATGIVYRSPLYKNTSKSQIFSYDTSESLPS